MAIVVLAILLDMTRGVALLWYGSVPLITAFGFIEPLPIFQSATILGVFYIATGLCASAIFSEWSAPGGH